MSKHNDRLTMVSVEDAWAAARFGVDDTHSVEWHARLFKVSDSTAHRWRKKDEQIIYDSMLGRVATGIVAYNNKHVTPSGFQRPEYHFVRIDDGGFLVSVPRVLNYCCDADSGCLNEVRMRECACLGTLAECKTCRGRGVVTIGGGIPDAFDYQCWKHQKREYF